MFRKCGKFRKRRKCRNCRVFALFWQTLRGARGFYTDNLRVSGTMFPPRMKAFLKECAYFSLRLRAVLSAFQLLQCQRACHMCNIAWGRRMIRKGKKCRKRRNFRHPNGNSLGALRHFYNDNLRNFAPCSRLRGWGGGFFEGGFSPVYGLNLYLSPFNLYSVCVFVCVTCKYNIDRELRRMSRKGEKRQRRRRCRNFRHFSWQILRGDSALL